MAARLIHKDFVGAYVYLIKVDGIVRYVGKGRRYRVLDHIRIARYLNERRAKGEKIKARKSQNKLAKALRAGSKIEHEILVNKLTDEEAYRQEVVEIGKHPKDQLWNLKAGGDGGDAEMMRSKWSHPARRKKWLKAIGDGKRRPEFREKARVTAKLHWDDPEFKDRQLKREREMWADPQKRAERIEILRKVWADPELSARKSALVRSQWTPERRAKQREWLKKKFSDPTVADAAVAKAMATKAAKRAKLLNG